MHDPVDSTDAAHRSPRRTFGPNRAWAVAVLGVAVLAALTALITADPQERLLVGVVALVLGCYAITDLVLWPRLCVDPNGVTVRTPSLRRHLSWAEIEVVRVDQRSRLGLASRALEIDLGTTLIVLSRRALGEDPRDVHAVLTTFDPLRRPALAAGEDLGPPDDSDQQRG